MSSTSQPNKSEFSEFQPSMMYKMTYLWGASV